MPDATLQVRFAGPFVSYQDAGRPAHMRFGVPWSGPMDRLAHAVANTALGQSELSTAIEVSLGGMVIECTQGEVTLAVAGGEFAIEHAGTCMSGNVVLTLRAGEHLSVRAGPSGSWSYIAFAGEVVAPEWLGHTTTHSTSGLGGGPIATGDVITIRNAEIRQTREGAFPLPDFIRTPGSVRVVMGPQDRYFTTSALEHFANATFTLSDAFDRMGVRLLGPNLTLEHALSIPSEPITRGAIQVAGDGVATILLADHQTTGGYPKIATVISSDLDRVAQMRAHDTLRFAAVSADEAVKIARNRADFVAGYLAEISIPKGNLSQRLMSANLISGVISATDIA